MVVLDLLYYPSDDKRAAGLLEAYLGAIVLSSLQKDLLEFNGLSGNTSDRNTLQRLNQKLMAEGKALPEYGHEQVGDGIGGTLESNICLVERK